ncbi:MAG: HD domain-containing protein [Acidimicrobiia bacterium]|nr:HD domain-containing protein [Acidimicrobiia bacterium]
MPLDAPSIITAATDLDERLGRQIEFILELDRLKTVMRRSRLVDASRYENTAEHSWHLAMMALLLAEWAGPEVDVIEATKAVLVHDIVEIDAGDIYIYDAAAREGKAAVEEEAADRLFGLLPADQGAELRRLWDLYEARDTPTGRFAYAIDRLQPLLLNVGSGGVSWAHHGIRADQVRTINSPIGDASTILWDLAQRIIDEAVAAGALADPLPAE